MVQTKTEKYPGTRPIIVFPIKEKDIIQPFTTNGSGNIRTNKRGWDGHNATVIKGEFKPLSKSIVPAPDAQLWSCMIYGGGIVSSIGLKNTEVTLIVHM